MLRRTTWTVYAGRWLQRHARQHASQDDFHLVESESGAQAVAQAAAEGEEGVGVDALVEEAVGPEGFGLRPQVGTSVGEVDAGRGDAAGRQLVAADAAGASRKRATVGRMGLRRAVSLMTASRYLSSAICSALGPSPAVPFPTTAANSAWALASTSGFCISR